MRSTLSACNRPACWNLSAIPRRPSIVAVSLSAYAKALLSQPATAAPSAGHLLVLHPPPAHVGDRCQLRYGCKVARALIGAAGKTEIATWMAASGIGSAEALEAKVLARISQLPVLFAA